MAEQFGGVMAAQYDIMLEAIKMKKAELEKKYEETKINTPSLTF